LHLFDPATTKWKNYTENDGLSSNTVHVIKQSPQGKVVVGTDWGASVFDSNEWRSDLALAFSTPAGTLVRAVGFDQDGNHWYGAAKAKWFAAFGVYVYSAEGKYLRNYTGREWEGVGHYDNRDIQAIERDNIGRMWVGLRPGLVAGEGGLTVLNPTLGPQRMGPIKGDAESWWRSFFGQRAPLLTRESTSGGLPGNDIRDIALDHLGNLWIATNGGLVEPSLGPGAVPAKWTRHNAKKKDSVLCDDIRSVAFDDATTTIWIGTSCGLTRLMLNVH
jgi:ligand-binding sensor domain-containing protein